MAILVLINLNNLFSQNPDFFIGPNINLFHDYHKQEGHYLSSYFSGEGFTAGLGLDIVKKDRIKLRITLQFDHYQGKLDITNGGLSYYDKISGKANKSIISLSLYTFNFRILKKMYVNFGMVFSGLIDESFIGTHTKWSMNNPNTTDTLPGNKYSPKFNIGCQGRLAYDFELTNSIIISPQYMYYYGISNEFTKNLLDAKSMRHYFCIGFKKKFN
ncbi:MAG: hypothetical protein IPO92_13395 [Saprospiraceae bacterium]|nr:hypothetical protein [Saprospiraceae bacterium]